MVCGNRREREREEEYKTVSEYLILPIIVNSNLQCTTILLPGIYNYKNICLLMHICIGS